VGSIFKRFIASCLVGVLLQASFAIPVDPKRPMVWAHAMVSTPLDLTVYQRYHPQGYDGLYPTDARRHFESRWQEQDIRSAKQAGVEGFSVDIYTDPGQINDYLEAADQVGAFAMAPCLDLGGLHAADDRIGLTVKAVEGYCRLAKRHPSAAEIDGRPLFFTYGSSMMSGDAWKSVRDQARADGYSIYMIADVNSGGDLSLQGNYPESGISANLAPVEGGYFFAGVGRWWDHASESFRGQGKVFVGSAMPGYDRTGGGFKDPRGTQSYRDQWHHLLDEGIPWMMVDTWNDLVENTAIMPTSDWSTTRSEITQWFAGKLHGRDAWKMTRLYVTTPKALYVGQEATIEALALNGGPNRLDIEIHLVDGKGSSMDQVAEAKAAPDADSAATIRTSFSQIPAGGFVRAVATVRGPGINLSETSAPIVVADRRSVPGLRLAYYSIPASRQLDHLATHLELFGLSNGLPGHTRVRTRAQARQLEVLRNNSMLRNEEGSAQSDVDLAEGSSRLAGPKWGFYLARTIDSFGKVGYSDPVFVAPLAGSSIMEDYVFTDPDGTHLKERSPFQRIGYVHGVTFSKDGSESFGAFDGTDYVDLTPRLTPEGPVQITIRARVNASGMLFCDSGGFWISSNAQGILSAVRFTNAGWSTATMTHAVPLGSWQTVTTTWNGTTLSVNADGVGSASCASSGGFQSGNRSIGSNPYGKRSSFFHGDIARVTIKSL
jgi:hypothetical protein